MSFLEQKCHSDCVDTLIKHAVPIQEIFLVAYLASSGTDEAKQCVGSNIFHSAVLELAYLPGQNET